MLRDYICSDEVNYKASAATTSEDIPENLRINDRALLSIPRGNYHMHDVKSVIRLGCLPIHGILSDSDTEVRKLLRLVLSEVLNNICLLDLQASLSLVKLWITYFYLTYRRPLHLYLSILVCWRCNLWDVTITLSHRGGSSFPQYL